MNAGRNRNGGSWASRLPYRLKFLFHLPHDDDDDDEPRRPFRMTHVPDRPARNPASHATPTDEECLRYLLTVQQQEEVNSPRRPCSSVYSCQEGEALPSLHGFGASGREFARGMGHREARSPRLYAERVPGWDAVITRPVSRPFTPDSSDPRDTWSPPLYRPHDSGTTIQSNESAPSQRQHIAQYNLTQHSLTHGTWPAQDLLPTDDAARRKDAQAAAHTYSPHSLPPEAQGDADGEDDVYEGWGEYYFDETNFRGRDGVGRYTGEITGYVRLPRIGEFF